MSEIEQPADGRTLNLPEPPPSPVAAARPVRAFTPAQRRWRRAGVTFGVVWCLLFMAAGTVFGHFYWGSEAFRRWFSGHGWSTGINIVTGRGADYDWTPEKTFPQQNSVNVLILGVDHDYDNKDQILRNTNGRSDSIMMARFDFTNHTVNALTIPRDTAVRIPGYKGIHKINAAHSYGGPELTVETIKQVFGVEADAVVSLNFEAFQQIVNQFDGVDINVEKKLDYDDNWGNLHIHLKPGFQHMNGYQAMGYVRMRHSDSDEMRSKRQHQFLEALRGKIKSPEGIGKLPKVMDTIADNIKRVNLTEDQLYTLANFARQLPKENIQIVTMPSFEGPRFVTVDTEKGAQVIQRLFFPNMQVALNIDAPDPNHVREMDTPYERGSRRKRKKIRATDEGATAAPRPAGGLSVEESSAPAPASGNEADKASPPVGGGSNEDHGAKDKETAPKETPGKDGGSTPGTSQSL